LKLASVGNLTQVAENKIFKNQRAKSKIELWRNIFNEKAARQQFADNAA